MTTSPGARLTCVSNDKDYNRAVHQIGGASSLGLIGAHWGSYWGLPLALG